MTYQYDEARLIERAKEIREAQGVHITDAVRIAKREQLRDATMFPMNDMEVREVLASIIELMR